MALNWFGDLKWFKQQFSKEMEREIAKMGCYAYCQKCGECVDRPTLREIIHDNKKCFHCHTKFNIDEVEIRWVLDGVLDRLEAIEAKLGIKNND